jgi:hypothetical protein
MASVLGLYVKRSQRWIAVGLQGIAIEHDNDRRHLAVNQLSPNTCTVHRQVIIQRHKKVDHFAVKEKG